LDVETELVESPSPDAEPAPRRRLPSWATASEVAVVLCFILFFLLYGLTPILGGDGLGLVGADEPRYAQIAHEMLNRFDSAHTLGDRLRACVTPYLYGHPWLEKPALYYWRAMFLFQDFGVHDWSARLPSTTFAFIMVGLIYLHMRRFRPGGHIDAALITVCCAAVIGFSRGASTDMQMAAPLAIGLLGWYAWYETNSKFWLYDIYFFTGLATLAKGPVAPFLAFCIIAAFAFLRRDGERKLLPWLLSGTWLFFDALWSAFFLFLFILGNLANLLYWQMTSMTWATWLMTTALFSVVVLAFWFLIAVLPILRRSLWWPGALLYFAMVLPWFIAVQHQNPTFFREFFLEHNLERFATDRFQHNQPPWYYLIVVVLGMMPWTVIAIRALVDGILTSVAEWRLRRVSRTRPAPKRPGDAFPEFLVLWALIPIVFFTFSDSKLPGYILPSIPPLAILTGDFLFRRRAGLNRWLLLGHAVLCGVMTIFALLLPWFVAHGAVLPPTRALLVALLAAAGAAALILIVVKGWGVTRLRLVTTCVLVVLMLFLYGVGPFCGIPEVHATKRVIHLLDRSYSARPLAERLAAVAPIDETVAVFNVRRDVEYGLAFYRNREVVNYRQSGVPDEQHILVVRVAGRKGIDLHTPADLEEYLADRHYEQLFTWPEQSLVVYMVGAR
jgi:4-amino-4-deoxy-L-arabinose transferase-like glycosyltransferase